jgi:RNA polymerase sigma factor (sigma-70 family)
MDNELRLVRALARRDRSAWADVYDRHVGDVFGLAYHLSGGNRAVAEEVNQEVWLLAIEQVGRFDPARGELRNWLLGIARHRSLRRYRHTPNHALDDGPDESSDAMPPPEVLEGVERAHVVRAALLCLHDDRRQVLLDKYAEGLSVAEIADRTGRSPKAVESLLSRAREQLRVLLRPYFSDPPERERHEPSDARPAR